MEYKDYYKVLSVARTANADEIKRAYRKLARRYHPDVSKESNAEEKFKEVQEAYEVLRDTEKLAAYDQLGAQWKAGEQFRPPPDWGQGFEFSFGGGGGGEDAAGFSDFFANLFGSRSPFGQPGGSSARRRGGDRHARIEIDLEDAYRGAERMIRLQNPEMTPDGRVTLREKEVRVTIPAGVSEGQQIRLRGQGESAAGQGMAGDLYLEIGIRPHALYQLEGRDVIVTVPVAPWEAALGAAVEVPTLGGPVEMKLPDGARSGQRLRLKSRGLPGKPPGDEFVVLKVVLPPADSQRARALYEQMQRELAFDPRAELKRQPGYRGAHGAARQES
jgi:curved DNA-binding protein